MSPSDSPASSAMYVFVYGTLREGEINDIARAAERHALAPPVRIGAAATHGRLFDFGAYPGLLSGADAHADAIGNARVVGDVFRITSALLPVLDAIEGIRADGRDIFYRAQCVVEAGGTRLTCYFYPVDPAATRDRPLIPQGDWIAYRRARDGAGGI
ncbi:gamma-glutamylcyclotransferase [Robbsia sp. Bb-Pol-6]|uniref:Gamma-glutamylcyclotransferase n=1 Tax=Robbsia betulipollinis TaxID=2981849 RepID=A0ABT3ZIH9_9BURK|nr:gamma-glutamylcyclotransferase family protein [Robbsia betulipollinis]MCY0386339.1 gamma-glutamylcyclotransferase [Robbsia betulipollinis]